MGLVFAGSLIVSVRAQNAGEMEIGVRAGLDPVEKTRRDHDPAYADDRSKQGKIYVLASVKEETSDQRLIKPVSAMAIANELKRQLQQQGYRPAAPGEKPDFVITVKYGRGMVNNPFINPDFLNIDDDRKFYQQHVGLSDDDPVSHVQTHQTFVGLEAKAAAVNVEKLVIQVRAWKYPPPADPKKKSQLAWMTTMYTGDPDHIDLNVVMPQLLASGAPYFNRHLDRERPAVINTAWPEGHVNVGAPEVVPGPKK